VLGDLESFFVYNVLKPATAGLVFRTLTGTTRCLEKSFLCLTYIAETLDVGDMEQTSTSYLL